MRGRIPPRCPFDSAASVRSRSSNPGYTAEQAGRPRLPTSACGGPRRPSLQRRILWKAQRPTRPRSLVYPHACGLINQFGRCACPQKRGRPRRETARRRSYVALAHQAPRPHDEHQHQEEVGNDGRRRRQLDRRELVEQRAPPDDDAGGAQYIQKRIVHRHGEGLQDADEHGGDQRARDPRPPTTTTTNTIGPTALASVGCVSNMKPPITPAIPANALPKPNTSTKMPGTSCPSALTIWGCVNAAWMMRPIRVCLSAR